MARPTTAPRLVHLRPAEVAAEACALVLRHTERQLDVLRPAGAKARAALPGDAEAVANASQIGLAVAALTRYAQTGELGDWADTTGPREAVALVLRAVFGAPSTPTDEPVEIGYRDASTGLGIVLDAALGRAALAERGGHLTVRQVAALGGVGPSHVHALARAESLVRVPGQHRADGRVRRADAVRFLAGRGVPGVP